MTLRNKLVRKGSKVRTFLCNKDLILKAFQSRHGFYNRHNPTIKYKIYNCSARSLNMFLSKGIK